MATFSLSDTSRRSQFTGNGSNVTFPFSFQVNATSDVKVYVGGTLKTLSTHYTIVTSSGAAGLNANGTGTVQFITSPTDYTPANGDIVTILSDVPVARTSVYTSGGNITAAALESDFDTQAMMLGDREERETRTVMAPVNDPTDVNMTLPAKASRLGKVLGFNSSTGNPEAVTAATPSNSEIRAAVEAASDSNVFTDADHSKLNAIEAGATGDQTNAEIKTAYEANSDTNAFTDADHTKLNNIEANADVTDATNVDAAGAVMNSDLDGKGELLVGDGSGDPTALSVGTNGYVLKANSSTSTGLEWSAAGSGGENNQNAFSNVAVSGQNTVEADSTTDTLTLAAGSNVTITTDSGTDTVTIAATDTNTTYSVGDGGLTQNNFTNTLKSKLDGIEASATADQTASEIRTLVESASDSNVFTDADHTKLNGIATSATANPNALDNLSEDSSPQLGGNLDVNGNDIVSTSNGAIDLDPNGSGKVTFKGNSTRGAGQFVLNCEQNSHGITVKGPPHSAGASYTLTLPNDDGSSGQSLISDGSGNLSWSTITSNATHTGEVTGSTSLTIADNVVDEANLKVSNSPTNGYVLTAQSGNTGGLTWEAANNPNFTKVSSGHSGDAGQKYIKIATIDSSTPSNSNSTFVFRIMLDGRNAVDGNSQFVVHVRTGNSTNESYVVVEQEHTNAHTHYNANNFLFYWNSQSNSELWLRLPNNASTSYQTCYARLDVAADQDTTFVSGHDDVTIHTGQSWVDTASFVAGTNLITSQLISKKFATVDVVGNLTIGGLVDGRDIAQNIPSSLGSAGQVLTVNSGASAAEWATAGGGGGGASLDLYAENYTSGTKPSASGNDAVSIGLNSSATNSNSIAIGNYASAGGSGAFAVAAGSAAGYRSVAIASSAYASATDSAAFGYQAQATNTYAVSLGRSSASGSSSFASAIDNNSSTYGASSTNSIAIGRQAKARDTRAISIGYNTDVFGYGGVCIGNDCYVNQGYGVAMGNYARTHARFGAFSYSNGYFVNAGDAQFGIMVLRKATTDAQPSALTSTGGAASSSTQLVLQNESAITFTGTVVCREDATDGDDYAGWEIKGVIMRQGQASDTTLGVGTVNNLYHTAGLANASVALSADTTNGALKVEATGIAGTNLHWVATLNSSEVQNS